MIPTVRDLRFVWEEMPQQILDEQQQKVRDSLRHALINWARSAGEASDYTDNLPLQCLHPVGHWYEVPNLLRNGVLARLLAERPQLKYLLLHNIDTLGADVDPALLGWHIQQRRVPHLRGHHPPPRRPRRRPGARQWPGPPRRGPRHAARGSRVRPELLQLEHLLDRPRQAARRLRPHPRGPRTTRQRSPPPSAHLAAKMPTYITLKEVKKRWGHGQEDIFPVTQFEKLWVDMTALPEVDSRFVVVPRLRGQQLKDQAQLDGWLRDGSAAYVERLVRIPGLKLKCPFRLRRS